MKKIFLLLIIAIFSVSCISNFDFNSFDISNLDPYIEKTAPIKQDTITRPLQGKIQY